MQPQENQTRNKVIYIGNFKPVFSTENDIKKSFETLGWEVWPVQEDEVTDETVNEIIRKESEYKFILFTRTWQHTAIYYRHILERTKLTTVSFHLDLYIGLERGKNLDLDEFFKSDYVFSADGGHQEEFRKFGINHIWLPPGILHTSCYLGEKKQEYEKDVIFVGSYRYHPEWNYRPKLIDWLRTTYGDRFRLWGSSETIRGKNLNDLYNSAKVIVGDSTYSPYYWSDRIPETVGRGGFLIHPFTEGLDNEFNLFKELVPYNYGDFAGLKKIIDYYIEHDEEREKIRLAGMEAVKEKHTYLNRLKTIISTIKI